MTAKANALSTARPESSPPSGDRLGPPLTTEDCLARIRVLGERVDGYVRFMCAIDSLAGTSNEAKHRAAVTFHDRLSTLERALEHIQDELRLG